MVEPQSRTLEYRWGVCDASEPEGVRTIKGYVTFLERQTGSGATLAYTLLFSNQDGLPISNFSIEDFSLFASAANLARKELGLPVEDSPDPIAALVKLAN